MPFSLPPDCITPQGFADIRRRYQEESLPVTDPDAPGPVPPDEDNGSVQPPPALVVRRRPAQ